MPLDPVPAAATIVATGIVAQWLAWRLQVPGIILLLASGFALGPWLGLIDPDLLLGDLLAPFVALGVALILFEGGTDLDAREIRAHGSAVTGLVTLGGAITWALAAAAARFILGWETAPAILLAAILVVTGPTVVIPLLRHIRARREVEAVARWEGILIDPIGALFAVVVFEATIAGANGFAHFFLAMGLGSVIGVAAALVLLLMEQRNWLPDFLASAFSLALVVAAFAAAEVAQHEAGLVSVTVMGVALANQRRVRIRHVLEWREPLSLLLLGSLFILLAARVEAEALLAVARDARAWLFVAALVLVVRPLSVLVATARSKLELREKAFLAGLAPRGIVAAAVAALFSLRLERAGIEAPDLVATVFFVVVVTVVVYGLAAGPWTRVLKVSGPEPGGIMVIGANVPTRAIAEALRAEEVRAPVLDTDEQALSAARMEDTEAIHARIESLDAIERLDLSGIGQMWSVTPSAHMNALATVRFADVLGRSRCLQVAVKEGPVPDRALFGATYQTLRDRLQEGWEIRRTPITDLFTLEDHRREHPDAIVLWVRDETGRIVPALQGAKIEAPPGSRIAALVPPEPEPNDHPAKRTEPSPSDAVA